MYTKKVLHCYRIQHMFVTMSTLNAIVEHIINNNIALPHAMKKVAYGAQNISRQFIERNEAVLKGLHYVSLLEYVKLVINLTVEATAFEKMLCYYCFKKLDVISTVDH